MNKTLKGIWGPAREIFQFEVITKENVWDRGQPKQNSTTKFSSKNNAELEHCCEETYKAKLNGPGKLLGSSPISTALNLFLAT